MEITRQPAARVVGAGTGTEMLETGGTIPRGGVEVARGATVAAETTGASGEMIRVIGAEGVILGIRATEGTGGAQVEVETAVVGGIAPDIINSAAALGI